MKTLLVIYQSMTGGTLQMARAAAAGARRASSTSELRVEFVAALQAQPEAVLAAEGYLFACPENLGSMAGLMKDFFDRCYYPALEQVIGRPYGTLICAGSDGTLAAQQIDRIATGWRLKLMAPPLIVCTHAQKPADIARAKIISSADLKRCEDLGATLAAGLAMGIY